MISISLILKNSFLLSKVVKFMVEVFFEKFGKFITDLLEFFGGLGRLGCNTGRDLLTPPRYISLLLDQIYVIGYQSVPLVLATCLSTGMVIALQFTYGLERSEE